MATQVIESINTTRNADISDDQILETIKQANPEKAKSFQKLQDNNISSTQILNKIIDTNSEPEEREPVLSESLLGETNLASDLTKARDRGLGKIAESEAREAKGEQTGVETKLQKTSETAEAGYNVLFAGIQAAVPDVVEDKFKENFADIFDNFASSPAAKALDFGEEKFDDLSPRMQANAKAVFNLLPLVKFGKLLPGKGKTKPVKPENLSELSQTIAPKTTGLQGQQLIDKGRIVKGKSNVFTGKKPDIILPDETLTRAEVVILKELPGSFDDSFKLADNMKEVVGIKAKRLAPELKKVKTTEQGRESLISEWEALKKAQQGDDLWKEGLAGNKVFQTKFEDYVDQAIGADNLDDLWKITTKYDNSINKNIINPSKNASPSIIVKHEMWLQNRRILKNIIENTDEAVGVGAKEAYRDMSALYSARNNIISKTKVDLRGAPGVLNKRNTVRFLLGVGAGAVGVSAF